MVLPVLNESDKVHGREHVNNWYSKKQSIIETLVFSAELVAMKVGVETLHVMQYKLWMIDIPISGPTYIYEDKMSVIHNASKPESTLKKKCNAIAYHAIHKSVATREYQRTIQLIC